MTYIYLLILILCIGKAFKDYFHSHGDALFINANAKIYKYDKFP